MKEIALGTPMLESVNAALFRVLWPHDVVSHGLILYQHYILL